MSCASLKAKLSGAAARRAWHESSRCFSACWRTLRYISRASSCSRHVSRRRTIATMLARARYRRKREIERLVAELAPACDVPALVEPLRPAVHRGLAPSTWASLIAGNEGWVRHLKTGDGRAQAPSAPDGWHEALATTLGDVQTAPTAPEASGLAQALPRRSEVGDAPARERAHHVAPAREATNDVSAVATWRPSGSRPALPSAIHGRPGLRRPPRARARSPLAPAASRGPRGAPAPRARDLGREADDSQVWLAAFEGRTAAAQCATTMW